MNKIQSLELKLLLTGCVSLIRGFYALIAKRRQLRKWARSAATVDNVQYDRDGNLKLTVSFQDSINKSHRVVIDASDGQNLGLGSIVQVAYDPAHPEKAIFADAWQIGLAIGGAIGLGFLLISLSVWVYSR